MYAYQKIVDIYRKYFESLLPYPVLLHMYKFGAFPFLKKKINELKLYYDELRKNNAQIDPALEEVINYIEKDPFQLIPYAWVHMYRNRKVNIYKDYNCGMYYVAENDKKLYFKKGMSKSEVANRFNALSSEQDIRSPHRYLTGENHIIGTINAINNKESEKIETGFCVGKGDSIIADLGAAEGNFSISIVDDVDKIFLFEYDTEWVRALSQTFRPYAEKVVIVEKMAADKTDSVFVSLDDFFENRRLNFIKADIEGYEEKALIGAQQTIAKEASMKVAVCAYHNYAHADALSRFLQSAGFEVTFSRGYLHPWTILKGRPYFTKGILRGSKKSGRGKFCETAS
jgi:hypothetical protein